MMPPLMITSVGNMSKTSTLEHLIEKSLGVGLRQIKNCRIAQVCIRTWMLKVQKPQARSTLSISENNFSTVPDPQKVGIST